MDYTKSSNEELLSCRMLKIKEISKFNNFQKAKKVTLNSAYGAMG